LGKICAIPNLISQMLQTNDVKEIPNAGITKRKTVELLERKQEIVFQIQRGRGYCGKFTDLSTLK